MTLARMPLADGDPTGPAPRIRTMPRETCPACGSPGRVVIAGISDRAHHVPGRWNIRECGTCESGWLDPQPIDEDIALCYTGDYYTRQADDLPQPASFLHPGWKNGLRRLILNARYGYALPAPAFPCSRRLALVLGAVPAIRSRIAYRGDAAILPWSGSGRLLDVGCGGGQYLALAGSLGWEVHGLDPDPEAAEQARLRSGADVQVGTLQTASYSPAAFDAVASLHAIEHTPDPAAFLRAALQLLKPGGIFYLQTPNFASLGRRRLAGDWFPLEVPRHLCMLSPRAIRRLLQQTTPWAHLTVRTLSRRAAVDRRLALAVRRSGSFDEQVVPAGRDRLGVAAWRALERAGNAMLHWGAEIEVIGRMA